MRQLKYQVAVSVKNNLGLKIVAMTDEITDAIKILENYKDGAVLNADTLEVVSRKRDE